MMRAAAVGAALLVTAFFALAVRQATSTDAAQSIVSTLHGTSPRQLDRAGVLLRHAAALNPDRSVDLLRAQLALQRQDRAGAVALLNKVVADEPGNIAAWTQLAFATARSDRAAYDRAVIRIRRLAPPVPAP